jgi:ADP-ribosylglycohydrolase
MTRKDHIFGGLLGAAVGDSMGAATEFMSLDMIKEWFGGNVTNYVDLPAHVWLKGAVTGMVTDDFSIGYYTAERLLEKKQKITNELAIDGLLRWNSDPLYSQCAGPTTRLTIARLKGEKVAEKQTWRCQNQQVTNGAGMKAGMMGLFNPGKVDSAIDDALTMCRITHNNTLALSAACAIAAATAQAFVPGGSYLELIEAGIYGAEKGFSRAEEMGAQPVAGCSISKKIGLAAEIGYRYQGNFEQAMRRVAEIIGCGLYAYESIPAVFGFIAANKGDALNTIYMAVNCGDDTDTVACMTGYIVGAYNGVSAFPKEYLSLINEKNGYDLNQMAEDIDALV